jgi:hypothetical protein
MFAMLLYLSLYLQDILGYSPIQAGLRFLPLTLLVFIVPALTRGISERLSPRVMLGSGLALVSLGLFLMNGIDKGSAWTTLLPGFLVAGIGIGLANPAIGSTALRVVEPARSGMASGFSNTCRLGGVAIGVAALGAIFQDRIATKLAEVRPNVSAGAAESVASGDIHAVGTGLANAAQEAFIAGLNEILLVGAATLLIGALAAFVLIRRRDLAGAREPAPAAAKA